MTAQYNVLDELKNLLFLLGLHLTFFKLPSFMDPCLLWNHTGKQGHHKLVSIDIVLKYVIQGKHIK